MPPGMAVPLAMQPSAQMHPSPHMPSPPHMHPPPHMHSPPQGARTGAEMQFGTPGVSGANEDGRGDAGGGEVHGGEGAGAEHTSTPYDAPMPPVFWGECRLYAWKRERACAREREREREHALPLYDGPMPGTALPL